MLFSELKKWRRAFIPPPLTTSLEGWTPSSWTSWPRLLLLKKKLKRKPRTSLFAVSPQAWLPYEEGGPRFFGSKQLTTSLVATSSTSTHPHSLKILPFQRKKKRFYFGGCGVAFMAVSGWLWSRGQHQEWNAKGGLSFTHGLEENEDMASYISHPWQLQFLLSLPLRWFSKYWGHLQNDFDLPVWLRRPLYLCYGKLFKCNFNELMERDLTKYPNLGSFFQRHIDLQCRPYLPSSLLVSPTDSTVISLGTFLPHSCETTTATTTTTPHSSSLRVTIKHISYHLKRLVPTFPWFSSSSPSSSTTSVSVSDKKISYITLTVVGEARFTNTVSKRVDVE
ncbi:phosphatidylserine decarboxylase 1 [Coelomomyces lativittatus]|nr:phosphatidylserine decarboxylase 1 [Coelomomyces lativittatus]